MSGTLKGKTNNKRGGLKFRVSSILFSTLLFGISELSSMNVIVHQSQPGLFI